MNKRTISYYTETRWGTMTNGIVMRSNSIHDIRAYANYREKQKMNKARLIKETREVIS